jgi:hypothetical protein
VRRHLTNIALLAFSIAFLPSAFGFLQRRCRSNDEEEQEKLRAVEQYVMGMKEDGSVGGGMLKGHVVELMDMLLPVWDEERTGEGE